LLCFILRNESIACTPGAGVQASSGSGLNADLATPPALRTRDEKGGQVPQWLTRPTPSSERSAPDFLFKVVTPHTGLTETT
jgi:hypothetical protein